MQNPISFKKLLVAFICVLPLTCYSQKWRVLESTQEFKQNGVYVVTNNNTFFYNPGSGRGSNYSNDTINFDGITIGNHRKGYKTYNSQNQLLSNTYVDLKTNNVWKPFQADSFIYANGRLVRHDEYKIASIGTTNDSLALKTEYAYAYDNQGLLLTKTQTGYSGKARPDPIVVWNYYTYNSKGQLIQDSVMLNNSGIWSDFELSNMDYDTNGNIILTEEYKWDSTGKKSLVFRTDYASYSNGLPAWHMRTGYTTTGGSYLVQKKSYTYNSSGQCIADTIKSDFQPLHDALTVYKYTSFGYYSEVEYGSIDGAGNVSFNIRTVYKYEHYWPSDISSKGSFDNSVVIYPNPAYNRLYLKSEIEIEAGVVYNTTGEVVHVLERNNKELNITKLPVGNYFLKLIVGGKTLHKRFAVVK